MKKKVIITMLIDADNELDIVDSLVEIGNKYAPLYPINIVAWNTELTKKEIETLMD